MVIPGVLKGGRGLAADEPAEEGGSCPTSTVCMYSAYLAESERGRANEPAEEEGCLPELNCIIVLTWQSLKEGERMAIELNGFNSGLIVVSSFI